MRHSHEIILALHLLALPLFSTHASAQVSLGNGVTAVSSASGADVINLGESATAGWVTQMPMSLSYGSTNVAVSFGSGAGVYTGSTYAIGASSWGNTAYFVASNTASVTMDFSATQRFFSTSWGTPDSGNRLQFYNGSTLLASMTGAQYMSAGAKGYAEFSFAETGFTRVVASTAGAGAFEFAKVSFDDVAPAPIPLNAASLGGLMSFLMMLGMNMKGLRGKGGSQAMLRHAFAALMPRRRALVA